MQLVYRYIPSWGEGFEVVIAANPPLEMDAMELVYKVARSFTREWSNHYEGQSERTLMFLAGAAWASRDQEEPLISCGAGSLQFFLREEKSS